MTRKEIINGLIEYRDHPTYMIDPDILDGAISALSAEGEYIKKEEFKSAIHNFFNGLKHNVTEEDIQAYIDALALYSFPDREKGGWEEVGDEYVEAYDIEGVHTYADKRRCNRCGLVHYFIEGHGIYNFCPNCGADMRC